MCFDTRHCCCEVIYTRICCGKHTSELKVSLDECSCQAGSAPFTRISEYAMWTSSGQFYSNKRRTSWLAGAAAVMKMPSTSSCIYIYMRVIICSGWNLTVSSAFNRKSLLCSDKYPGHQTQNDPHGFKELCVPVPRLEKRRRATL